MRSPYCWENCRRDQEPFDKLISLAGSMDGSCIAAGVGDPLPGRAQMLGVFAPLLILTGLAGFLIPADKSLTSGAPLYNIFHLVFGCLGLFIALARKQWLTESFNIGFGLLDLYQAFASYAHLFPERYFRWTTADDWLHIVIGSALVSIGCYGAVKRRSAMFKQHC